MACRKSKTSAVSGFASGLQSSHAHRSTFSIKRDAIALMLTLFFIIAITVALGISLKQVRLGNQSVDKEHFMVQSAAILDDVLTLLKSSSELNSVSDAQGLNLFLSTASIIPFEVNALAVKIEIASAGAKININSLNNAVLKEAFINYLVRYNVSNPDYLMQLIYDASHGVNENGYQSDIFDANPSLYRDKIVSQSHLNTILKHYVLTQHENSVMKLPWNNLVRFDDNNDSSLDANYLSADVWQMLVPDMSEEEAAERASGLNVATSVEELGLNGDDAAWLTSLNGSGIIGFYTPKVAVNVDILEHNQSAKISFDYNLASKKGNHFEYGI